MSTQACLELLTAMLTVTLIIVTPLLVASLVAGVAIGVVQTATQVNEPSLSYAVKVVCVIVVLLAVGSMLAEKATTYARSSFTSIGDVVHQR
jgi:flagellar biosynthetic protein FliQ